MKLPSLLELEQHPQSIRELAARLYPDLNYDLALPQPWVDHCIIHGFDPRRQTIWGYPPNELFGKPYPLTQEANNFLETIQ